MRAEIIPRWTRGRAQPRLLIHHPASNGSCTGEDAQLHGPSARFSRPSFCHCALRRDGERGSKGMLKKKDLVQLWLNRPFFGINLFAFLLCAGRARGGAVKFKSQDEAALRRFFFLPLLFFT